MAENEKFNGNCKVLQERLRRYCKLVGEEVHELPNGTIFCDMAYDTTLTLYAEPFCLNEYTCYGIIGYKERKKNEVNINMNNVQYLFEKMNNAICEIETRSKED